MDGPAGGVMRAVEAEGPTLIESETYRDQLLGTRPHRDRHGRERTSAIAGAHTL